MLHLLSKYPTLSARYFLEKSETDLTFLGAVPNFQKNTEAVIVGFIHILRTGSTLDYTTTKLSGEQICAESQIIDRPEVKGNSGLPDITSPTKKQLKKSIGMPIWSLKCPLEVTNALFTSYTSRNSTHIVEGIIDFIETWMIAALTRFPIYIKQNDLDCPLESKNIRIAFSRSTLYPLLQSRNKFAIYFVLQDISFLMFDVWSLSSTSNVSWPPELHVLSRSAKWANCLEEMTLSWGLAGSPRQKNFKFNLPYSKETWLIQLKYLVYVCSGLTVGLQEIMSTGAISRNFAFMQTAVEHTNYKVHEEKLPKTRNLVAVSTLARAVQWIRVKLSASQLV
jgi:hypothetical protein